MQHRVIDPKSSKLRIFALNQMLKQTVKPDRLSLDKGLSAMRARMDRVGKVMSLAPRVANRQDKIDHVEVEWLLPRRCNESRCLLYFHGGGYAIGSPLSHRAMVSWLAASLNVKVLTFHYRKAPEHPFPAALEDAITVYRWLLENGFRSQGIAFAGDSAGGGLVFSTLLNLKGLELEMPAAAVGISPWLDLTLSGSSLSSNKTKDHILSHGLLEQYAALYAGAEDRAQPQLSPLFGDLSGLPPILLQVGSDEVLLDDSIRMMQQLHQARVSVTLEEWRDMQHVWHFTSRFLSEGRGALKGVANFIEAVWNT